ncbi:MAG: peptide ABC transporter ATP-binding protein [Candidatus Brocadia sp. WS118]|nr:MAG: peptide ABC transporter ATP-binding protein [Candidatus Brocadia sp. WS118]
MIEICNLLKEYGRQPLFKGLNLNISKGSVVAIIGPSGSGKSTLLRCMNGLEAFQRGCVSVEGHKLYGVLERDYNKGQESIIIKNIRRKVGMVFQQFHLFPHMSVLHNITTAPIHVLGIQRAEAETDAISLLRKVHLEEKAQKYPGQLSGGEQQRVAIARALAMKPEAILFDEPTSSLDPEMIEEVLQVIKGLVLEGMTTVIATHEMAFARDVSTHVVFLDKGEIVEQGSPKAIFSNPQNDRMKAFLSRFMK